MLTKSFLYPCDKDKVIVCSYRECGYPFFFKFETLGFRFFTTLQIVYSADVMCLSSKCKTDKIKIENIWGIIWLCDIKTFIIYGLLSVITDIENIV
jgi:hypothetical protein